MSTIWENDLKTNYEALTSNIETDVLVIGGGICGILCAYRLAKEGKKVVLAEEDKIASKRTKRTTAFVTALQDIMYSDLIKSIGKENARLYLQANLDAIKEYERLSYKYNFDFERVSSYKYSNDDIKVMMNEVDSLKSLGYEAFLRKGVDLPIDMKCAIEFKNQAQINPLMLIAELKRSFTIYENTKIVKIKNNYAYTNFNSIKAKYIIVCTGYPFLKLKGKYFVKLTQEKSYVAAVKTDKNIKGNSIGVNKEDFYFRNYKDYLIIGATQNRTGKNSNGYEMINDYIDNKKLGFVECNWVNQDCVTLDSLPYIGRYGNMENVYVATGFNLWGMTGSMISSMLISDLINGKKNKYEMLFSPKRQMKKISLLKNLGHAIIGLITPKLPRCSHLGCALKWNKKEKCYECPCHGSKYDKNGKVLQGPGQKNV